MEFNINPTFTGEKSEFLEKKHVIEQIKELNSMYLDETYKGNKVAYYYEDQNNHIISYNTDICFYAASSIKILVCLIILEKAERNEIDLEEKLLVTMDELRQGTGIIKNQEKDTYYSILDLIKLAIIESDNTAYIKLVSMIGKENIKEYGLSLGATHTMEGKETDSYGVINCKDMIIYWKKIKEYITGDTKYGAVFKEYLSNPTFKIVEDNVINSYNFVRKYGSFGIAYHEAGYIETENPFFAIILTQLNQMDYKDTFINEAAKRLLKLNKEIND